MTWNCHQFDSLHSLVFRGNVNDVNAFRVLECCRETLALPGRNYSLFKYVISMYFHVSQFTIYVPGCLGTRFYTLIPTSATARFARSRRGLRR
nr:MAG TPA: hypothetical protein [Siphoviridae sp. ctEci12]